MQCNIDARGKAVRLISGAIWSVVGLVLLLLTAFAALSAWAWVVGALALLGGLFQVYEARTGWCVVRALGFRTPV